MTFTKPKRKRIPSRPKESLIVEAIGSDGRWQITRLRDEKGKGYIKLTKGRIGSRDYIEEWFEE